jgi:hypothetical protein
MSPHVPDCPGVAPTSRLSSRLRSKAQPWRRRSRLQRCEDDRVAYASAAGRKVPSPERRGRPRPKVTEQEVIVVELPLNAVPDDWWGATFRSKIAQDKHPSVGWVHVEPVEDGYAVTFRLLDQDHLLAAVDNLDALIEQTTEQWLSVSTAREL